MMSGQSTAGQTMDGHMDGAAIGNPHGQDSMGSGGMMSDEHMQHCMR